MHKQVTKKKACVAEVKAVKILLALTLKIREKKDKGFEDSQFRTSSGRFILGMATLGDVFQILESARRNIQTMYFTCLKSRVLKVKLRDKTLSQRTRKINKIIDIKIYNNRD